MASAMRLAGRPLFNGSAKNERQPGSLEVCELTLSTNLTRKDLAGRQAGLRVEGCVMGSPPIYSVVAYFDSTGSGGYDALTATSVPDAEGRFAIEVSDLAPCSNGNVRIELCHANGAVSERHLGFSITSEHRVDLSQWELRRALDPLADAVGRSDLSAAQKALEQIQSGAAPELAKTIALRLTDTLKYQHKLSPAEVPMSVTNLALGDARATSAEVGWLEPAANRIPPNDQVSSPLLDSGKLHATGLYAHAPSRYVFDLGGKWKELDGTAGLHTLHPPYGSVVFIIKADGREVFRSPVIRRAQLATYGIDVGRVKLLELIVDPTPDGKHNDWGLWLDTILRR
jgi:hypothetical protein